MVLLVDAGGKGASPAVDHPDLTSVASLTPDLMWDGPADSHHILVLALGLKDR